MNKVDYIISLLRAEKEALNSRLEKNLVVINIENETDLIMKAENWSLVYKDCYKYKGNISLFAGFVEEVLIIEDENGNIIAEGFV